MENKKVVQLPVEYQVGNTKYSVKPIYGEAPNKETVEDKIRAADPFREQEQAG